VVVREESEWDMLRVTKATFCIPWILVLLGIAFVPNAATQQVLAPSRQVAYEDAFTSGSTLPKWDGGYLISWRTDTTSSDTAENLFLYNRDGSAAGKARIWLDGATLLRIVDAAAWKDGRVALVGWAITSSGAHSAFLADVLVANNSATFVKTSPFEARAVGFGPEGTIWVLGLEVGPGRGKEPAADHYMIQAFGPNDVRKGEYLLQSHFGCELAAQINGIPRVIASDDRIGLFAPFCHTWVELSPTGELLNQWKWLPLSPVHSGNETVAGITSVALTSKNELYGWGRRNGTLYQFDRKATVWIPLGTDSASGAGAPFSALLGADGDDLVSSTGAKMVGWFGPKTTK
jgi:hypothetical protein